MSGRGYFYDVPKIDTMFEDLEDRVGTRLSTLETLGGLNPGNTSDATVANLLVNSETQSNGALKTAITTLANGGAFDTRYARRDELPVHISYYGAKGDGVTDDTAALKSAFASGKTVIFDGSATYCFDAPLGAVKSGTRLITSGCLFKEIGTPADSALLSIESEVHVDRLEIEAIGGEATRGVYISGNDVTIGTVKVTSPQLSAYNNTRRAAVIIGKEGGACRGVKIDEIIVENYRSAVNAYNLTDCVFGSITAKNYVRGIYLENPLRVSILGGSVSDPIPSMISGGPGENGILIEADGTVPSGELVIRDFAVYGSGEHGYRVGGQTPIKGITFENCLSRGTGAGNGTGGCGFKVLGPTSILSGSARHSNVRISNCIVENQAYVFGAPNFAAVNIGKSRNVVIEDLIVRAAPAGGTDYSEGTVSYSMGIALMGCENVHINNPLIEKVNSYGVYIYNGEDSTTYNWGGEPTNIIVSGGTIRDARVGMYINVPSKTIRRVNLEGTLITGGERAVYVRSTTTVNRCHLAFTAYSQSVETVTGCNEFIGDVIGDMTGDSGLRAGSTWKTWYPPALKKRGSGVWVDL